MRFDHVEYDVDDHVGIITLDRPEAANAQSEKVLVELDEAWRLAESDREVKVIVLRSTGKHFSAGHDMSGTQPTSADTGIPLPDAMYDWETRYYFHFAKRWRDVPKPSIAAVQGKCIAAGLMLCWPCDLIVAAENAEFSDPVLFMGICGVEYHAHTWEFGPRKAKEILFTGDSITAGEARQLGMVNQVVPPDELLPATLRLARRIARVDGFALRMAKRAVNRALDAQGFSAALEASFDMHHLGHNRALVITGDKPALVNLAAMKERRAE
ncbi:enoyl-CoA hydratase [Streptomyces fuscichromogenes]|uniref:Enoyl-CoA hydratase n=1 Tax=Streptomyces fuscichromogenes TaxID=1324013 RepID=A0A917X9R6_9ACTN|nr:enoyl-CoA hydratase [Streptomyces fuscichromogenes]GGM97897.1 enoyl-CoA hydratase [Streptomyces fuscichromogenes]